MKTLKYFIIISAMFISGSAFAQKITKAEVQVNGLTCSMCSKATETSLQTLGFIDSVTPDLNRNVFVLSFKADQQVDIDQIRDKVEDAGFSIGTLSATMTFKNTVINENGIAQADGKVYQFVNTKNTTLDGPVTAQVIDKDFISSSAFKKKAAVLKSPVYLTGKGMIEGKEQRVYHLSI
jgi:copper chaperone CopZ